MGFDPGLEELGRYGWRRGGGKEKGVFFRSKYRGGTQLLAVFKSQRVFQLSNKSVNAVGRIPFDPICERESRGPEMECGLLRVSQRVTDGGQVPHVCLLQLFRVFTEQVTWSNEHGAGCSGTLTAKA